MSTDKDAVLEITVNCKIAFKECKKMILVVYSVYSEAKVL